MTAPGPPPLRSLGLVLHRDGRFTHEGHPIANRRLLAAFERGVRFLPAEGKYVVQLGHFRGQLDVEEAGWSVAQGYLGLQYAAIGRDPPVIREIVKMFRDEGKEVPKYVGSPYYNRGVLHGALIAEGIRLAIQNYGLPVTPDKVRKGYEAIKNFDASGLGPALTITPKDHEGGGYLRVYQVKGNEWVPVSGWIRDYRDEVMSLVRKANNK